MHLLLMGLSLNSVEMKAFIPDFGIVTFIAQRMIYLRSFFERVHACNECFNLAETLEYKACKISCWEE